MTQKEHYLSKTQILNLDSYSASVKLKQIDRRLAWLKFHIGFLQKFN